MTKVAKINKDHKAEYFTGKIEDKGHYLQIVVNENGIIVQAEKYSELGQNVEEAFLMTFDDIKILEIRTWIITESYIIIEMKTEL